MISLDKTGPIYILKSFDRGIPEEYLKIRIDDIKDKELAFAAEEPVGDFPILKAMESAGECQFLAPLNLELTAAREYDHFRVQGSVSTAVRLTCSRCLVEFSSQITSQFTIFYLRGAGPPQDEEVELSEEDLVSVTFEGDEIDLSPEIAEQVSMELPYKPLCSEECQGLCVTCGADLNNGECGCPGVESNLRFSALKNFKVKK